MNYTNFQFKMIIGIRTDLKISKGQAAQIAAHSAILAAREAEKRNKSWFNSWLHEGQMKVVIKIPQKSELLLLQNKAQQNDIPNIILTAPKKFDINSNTQIAIALGPAPNNQMDKLTSDYKLL